VTVSYASIRFQREIRDPGRFDAPAGPFPRHNDSYSIPNYVIESDGTVVTVTHVSGVSVDAPVSLMLDAVRLIPEATTAPKASRKGAKS